MNSFPDGFYQYKSGCWQVRAGYSLQLQQQLQKYFCIIAPDSMIVLIYRTVTVKLDRGCFLVYVPVHIRISCLQIQLAPLQYLREYIILMTGRGLFCTEYTPGAKRPFLGDVQRWPAKQQNSLPDSDREDPQVGLPVNQTVRILRQAYLAARPYPDPGIEGPQVGLLSNETLFQIQAKRFLSQA